MSFESANNYSRFQLYKQYMRTHQYIYKGIDMLLPISIDIAGFYLENQKRTIRSIGDLLTRRFHPEELCNAFEHYKTVITFDMLKRKDHEQLMEKISESIDDALLVRLPVCHSPIFNVFQWIYGICWFIKQRDFTFNQCLFLSAKLLWYKRVVDTLNETMGDVDLHGKNFIPFCAYESILLHYFKAKGATTFALFHGMNGHYQFFIPRDAQNGELGYVDKILAISEYQKKMLIQDWNMDEEKIFIVGNAKYGKSPYVPKGKISNCIILGGIATYDPYLFQLLQLIDKCAERTNIHFKLRPHPFSRILQNYPVDHLSHISVNKEKKTLQEMMVQGEYDAAIILNSFSYYEALWYGLYTFRYKEGENMAFAGIDDYFSTEEDFLNLVKRYEAFTDTNYLSTREKVLSLEMGAGINNYNDIINEFTLCDQ